MFSDFGGPGFGRLVPESPLVPPLPPKTHRRVPRTFSGTDTLEVPLHVHIKVFHSYHRSDRSTQTSQKVSFPSKSLQHQPIAQTSKWITCSFFNRFVWRWRIHLTTSTKVFFVHGNWGFGQPSRSRSQGFRCKHLLEH